MAYTIDENVSGLERQKLLAQTFNPSSIRFLDESGDLSGAKLLDLGCGIGETSRMLAERVGPGGSVHGIDFDPALVESAQSLNGQENITFAQGDAQALDFADASFDVVYTRFLLVHLQEPQAALKEMTRVCKPQGKVIVHDGDFSTIYTGPDPAGGDGINKLFTLFNNTRIGIRLWHIFRDLGYENIEFRVDRMLVRDPANKTLAAMTVEAMREAAVQSGLMDQAEIDALCQTLRAGIDDENYLIGFPEIYAAWIKKP